MRKSDLFYSLDQFRFRMLFLERVLGGFQMHLEFLLFAEIAPPKLGRTRQYGSPEECQTQVWVEH